MWPAAIEQQEPEIIVNTRRLALWQVACVAGVVGLAAGPAGASVMLDVLADAYVDDFPHDGVPDAVENTDALLLERGVIAATGVPFDSRPVMVFDLSPFGGTFLSAATLSMYGTTTPCGSAVAGDPLLADLLVYAGDGSISLSDFDRPGAVAGPVTIPGGAPGGVFSPPELVTFDTDVTSAVQPLLDASDPFGTFRLEASGEAFFGYITAGEAPPPYQAEFFAPGPRLSLAFGAPPAGGPAIPEPGSAVLVAIGLAASAGSRWRRAPCRH